MRKLNYYLCTYCGIIERLSTFVPSHLVSHTHYPNTDKKRRFKNISVYTLSLWQFSTLTEAKKKQRYYLQKEAKNGSRH